MALVEIWARRPRLLAWRRSAGSSGLRVGSAPMKITAGTSRAAWSNRALVSALGMSLTPCRSPSKQYTQRCWQRMVVLTAQ